MEDHAEPYHKESLTEGHKGLPGVSLLDAHVVDDLCEHELLFLDRNFNLLVSVRRGLSEVAIISVILVSLEINLATILIFLLFLLSQNVLQV